MHYPQTFAKLKTGETMVVWSDNVDEGTYDLHGMDKNFDIEVDALTTVSRNEVVAVSRDLAELA